MRRFSIIYTLLFTYVVAIYGQNLSADQSSKKFDAFNHLDLSLTAGTTGIGFDVASPVGDYVQLRTGFAVMPRFHKNMYFDIQVGDDEATSHNKFENLKTRLKDLIGQDISDQVTMIGRPTYYNFKLMVDVFPFKNNKNWHFTTGFYLGNEKIADCINDMSVCPSLTAVNIYNKLYDDIDNIMDGVPTKLRIVGQDIEIDMSGDFPHMIVNGKWIDLDPNDNPIKTLQYGLHVYGKMKIHVGDFKDGTPYYMYPDENCTVSANGFANVFKPYLGFGYGGRLSKKSDKYFISFDCGAMFWGGSPDIITHEGVNITKDLVNIKGSVKDYVDLINAFKIMPVLNVRLTRRLF